MVTRSRISYNDLGLRSGEREPVQSELGAIHEAPVATYTYNQDGDLSKATDGDDHTTTYVYNALNEETSVTNGDGDDDAVYLRRRW